MTNVFASAIFSVRNANKAEHGDIGRAPVAIGQSKNVLNSVVKYDNAIGKTTKSAVTAIKTAGANSSVFEYAAKGVNFASKHVNSLICVSAGVKVYQSEDKVRTGVEQAGALTSMFAVERAMKDHGHMIKEIKGVDKVIEKVMKFSQSNKKFKALPAILKGIGFVAGSMTGYFMGEKAAHVLVGAPRG